MIARLLCLILLSALGSIPAAAATDDDLWALLRGGGQVVLLRHAETVAGTGDPPGFRIEDCATQRNLSDAGRAQASRIGQAFAARGVPIGRVLSSRWCRCLETARLAFGSAEETVGLNSFFDARAEGAAQTAAARALVTGHRGAPDTLVLVTHQVNITALTGIYPASGEVVVLTPGPDGAFSIAGRLRPGG